MSSNVRRVLAIVVTVAVMATSVISSMGALAEDVIPTGYNKATGLNVNLAENEYYQPISGFEAMGTDWGVHAYNKGTASESTGIKNSGSKSAKMVHKGFTNEIGSMDFISVINQQNLTIDASKANYLQFYVKNDSVTDIEIAKLCINGPENAQASTITNADVKFFDYSKADKKWEDGKVQTSSTKLDGKKYTAIVVGAGKEGLIRIPMSIWGSPASITRFMFWTSVTLGGAADQTLYIVPYLSIAVYHLI